MKLLIVCALLLCATGCVFGLTPEQAAEVRQYETSMAAERAKLKPLQEKILALTDAIESLPEGSSRLPALWAERDQLVVLAAEVTARIKVFSSELKALKAKGVPVWSVVLNGVEQLVLALFGGGGLLAGAIAGIKNLRLRKVTQAVISGIENSTGSGDGVRSAVKSAAIASGVEGSLLKMVKKAGG